MARPRSFDEDAVCDLARDVFWDRGYAATSIQDLTAATGLNRSSLYGAFGDKNGLFLRAFDRYVEQAMGGVEHDLVGEDAGAWARVRQHVESKVAESTASDRGCLLAKAAAELASGDPVMADRAKAAYTIYESHLRDAVAAARRAGELPGSTNPHVAAALLLTTLRGIEVLGRSRVDGELLRRAGDGVLEAVAHLQPEQGALSPERRPRTNG